MCISNLIFGVFYHEKFVDPKYLCLLGCYVKILVGCATCFGDLNVYLYFS